MISGLKLAAQAVMFLGRALLFTPVGAAVAIIAGAAFLIWKNWDALKARFAPLWDQVKGIFSRALSWFKTLPDVFKTIGSNLLEGLRSGIMAKWESVKAGLSSIASGIKDTFKSALGIHSPSRVFAGYGADIGQGLIDGVTGRKTPWRRPLASWCGFPSRLSFGSTPNSVLRQARSAADWRRYPSMPAWAGSWGVYCRSPNPTRRATAPTRRAMELNRPPRPPTPLRVSWGVNSATPLFESVRAAMSPVARTDTLAPSAPCTSPRGAAVNRW